MANKSPILRLFFQLQCEQGHLQGLLFFLNVSFHGTCRKAVTSPTGWNWSRDSKVTRCREHNLHKTGFHWLRLELIYPDESSFIWVCILCPLLPCHSFHYPSFCVAVYCQLGRTRRSLELLWLLTGHCACASCLEGQRQWVVRLWQCFLHLNEGFILFLFFISRKKFLSLILCQAIFKY